MTSRSEISQEFKLLRIGLLINILAATIFLPISWKYTSAGHTLGLYLVLIGTLIYSGLFYRLLQPGNYRLLAVFFIFLLALFNSLAIEFHPLPLLLPAYLLTFTFIVIFNVICVSWPEVAATDLLLMGWTGFYMLWPGTGFQASVTRLGLDPHFIIAAFMVYYGLILILGTGMVEVKRRTERQLRRMNANLNQLVEEKATQIQIADLEARQYKEQVEEILRSSPVGVVICDDHMALRYTNGVHFKFVVENENVQEQEGGLFPLAILIKVVQDAREKMRISGEEKLIGQRLEVAAPDHNGKTLRYSYMRVKLHPGNQDAVRWVLITEDITREEMFQQRLIQADHLASLGIMAAGLAHEVNNPMSVIKIYADVLERGLVEPEKQSQIMATVKTNIARIERIVTSFLTFARQEKQQMEWVDVKSVLQETLDMALSLNQYGSIRIQTQLADNVPPVFADQHRLAQVFINLLNNARDAMRGKDGVLQVVYQREGDDLVIQFKDTGKGIKPEDRQHLFTPFFTTKECGEGTGLGLSISYGIIQDHHGTLDVESSENLGSTFTIRLPITQPTAV